MSLYDDQIRARKSIDQENFSESFRQMAEIVDGKKIDDALKNDKENHVSYGHTSNYIDIIITNSMHKPGDIVKVNMNPVRGHEQGSSIKTAQESSISLTRR